MTKKTEHAPTEPQQQIASLQILRAVAAASVVFYHIGDQEVFGSFGVDLFFVLSGFVIAMVGGPRTTPSSFAFARITRIVPLYWILTTAVLLIALTFPSLLTNSTPSAVAYLKSILFIPYFNEVHALQPMLGLGWTLNYEMLFYSSATFSLILFRNFPFSATTTLVIAIWILGLALPRGTAYGEFLASPHLLEFTFGMVAWHVKDDRILSRSPKALMLGAAGALYCLMAYAEYRYGGSIPLLSYGLGASLIVVFLYQGERLLNKKSCVIRSLIHAGDASYATYLSHLFLLDLCKRIGKKWFDITLLHSTMMVAVLLISCMLLGSAIYIFIDRSIVRILRKRPWQQRLRRSAQM